METRIIVVAILEKGDQILFGIKEKVMELQEKYGIQKQIEKLQYLISG
jgi:hypothetical protein